MSITISESAIVTAVERHIRSATRNENRCCFIEMLNYDKNIAAADSILALAEKESGLTVRKAQSINGLTKRLASLINGGSKRA